MTDLIYTFPTVTRELSHCFQALKKKIYLNIIFLKVMDFFMAQEILLIFLVFMKAVSFDLYCLTYFVLGSPVADPQLI